MTSRETYPFYLWRGDQRIGTLRFDRDVRVDGGMALSLVDLDREISDLASVTQLFSDNHRAFEQDGEPRIPQRPAVRGSTGSTFALRGMDREVAPDRQLSIRSENGEPVSLRMLTLTEIILPEDWSDEVVGVWSSSAFPQGRRWEVTIIAGPPFHGLRG